MTKTELNKFREALEAKQTELAQVLRNREGIAIEKSPDALDEVQNAAERELAIRNQICCAMSARRCIASRRALLEFACIAKRISVSSGFMPSLGQPTASSVRRSQIGTTRTVPNRWMTSS
jgi:hypothetical protein